MIVIRKGYRRLRKGQMTARGDKWTKLGRAWIPARAGIVVGCRDNLFNQKIYVRRIGHKPGRK